MRRDVSSSESSTRVATRVAWGEKRSQVSLPKRDELWLRIVFALPNASSSRDVCSMLASRLLAAREPTPVNDDTARSRAAALSSE